jgi:hypothetical protein
MAKTATVKQPNQMSKLQTAAIIIIAFTVVIGAFYYLGVFDGTGTDIAASDSCSKSRRYVENRFSRDVLHKN